MLDFSWSELALIGVVALVVIGPKDLPKALRTAGVWVRKARTISREFQSSVEQMMREAELDEVKKQIESVSSVNIAKEIESAVDPTGELAESLKPPEMPDLNKIGKEDTAPAPVATADAEALASPAPLPVASDAPAPALEPPKPDAAKPEAVTPDSAKPASVP
ncbi:MAG TPA: Sec-independent protein translocase protein TatB [Stellaceae bacterium]|jgi:sec-independent protein translocase protein TatB|nr:Sec-independent protein translocase protein TatB [Stellaceae bacterium]